MKEYNFIKKTIKEAGKLLLQKREEGFFIMQKNDDPRNIITNVDKEINKFIINAIKKEFPSHGIYSEEGEGIKNTNDYLWTIDPIDGTANFSRNIPHFAVCIGVLKKEVPVAGGVYNPITDELFSFKKGEGVFLNNKTICVSKITELSKAHILFHAGRKENLREWGGESYKTLLGNAKKTSNLASSSLDACFVAAGRVEANVYGTLSTLDISSAIGILKEAGGIIANEDKEDISLSSKPQKVFMTNNKKILNSLIELI